MIYKYIRFSTERQDEASQNEIVDNYLATHGMKADFTFKDEGISGGVSFYDRKLYQLVCKLNEGDIIIVSEISRLGRSMSDLNTLINAELKPRKARLIIVKMSLDLDCSNLKAIDEMILFAFSFSAQIEKEMIQERTRAALAQRKHLIEEQGFFVSKSGNTVTALGRQKGAKQSKETRKAIGEASARRAAENENNANFERYISIFEAHHGSLADCTDKMVMFARLAEELNRLGYATATGKPYDANRAYNAYRCMKYRNKNKQGKEASC